MNTINFITAIALLACILTPAYVLYFLKYQLFADQKKHKTIIDEIDKDLRQLHYEVEKIQFDEIENRTERNKEILDIKDKLKSLKGIQSITRNDIENMNVQMSYIRTTAINDISKANERIDLQKSLHTAFVSKSEFSLETTEKNLNVKIDYLKSLIDSLERSKEMMLHNLNKLNTESKQNKVEVAVEVEVEAETEVPIEKSGKKIIKEKKTQDLNESSSQVTTRKVTPKRESLRRIKTKELEEFFKQKTGLTYRGYVLKFGQDEFLHKKKKIYKNLYYQKFSEYNRNK